MSRVAHSFGEPEHHREQPHLTTPHSGSFRSVLRDPNARSCGLLVPVSALRSEYSLGIGDTGGVMEAIDFCARNNLRILQVLPISETGGDHSPYLPISNFALDPMYVECIPSRVPGLTQEILSSIATPNLIAHLEQGRIDYPAVKELKRSILRAALQNLVASNDEVAVEQKRDFERFQERYGETLLRYTVYRHLVDHHHGNNNWQTWPKELQTWEGALHWVTTHEGADRSAEEMLFHAYAQWVSRSQWNDVTAHARNHRVELMGDIPFGVSINSCDVWANQELFDLEWCIGAPPESGFAQDPFTRTWGQNWGAPLYNGAAHAATQFRWWRERVGHVIEIFDSIRFDHGLGAFRVYAFPWPPQRNCEFEHLSLEEAKNRTGGKLPHFFPGPDAPESSALVNEENGRRFFTMLREAAGDAGIMVEDLGAHIPDYVRRVLAELDMPNIYIPHFHPGADNEILPQAQAPKNAIATFGTHDHNPIRVALEEKIAQSQGPDNGGALYELNRWMRWIGSTEVPPTAFTPELHLALLEALLRTNSRAVVVNLPDLFGSTEQWNLPGLGGGGCWTERMGARFSVLEQEGTVSRKLGALRRVISETSRGD